MTHQEIDAILARSRAMDASSAAFAYAQGAEWEYDEACDCPRCTDYRDTHCINCGEPHVWHGRDEADRSCPSCRTRAKEWDHEDDWKPGR